MKGASEEGEGKGCADGPGALLMSFTSRCEVVDSFVSSRRKWANSNSCNEDTGHHGALDQATAA